MFPSTNAPSGKVPDSPDSVFIEQPTQFNNDVNMNDDDATVTNEDTNTNTGGNKATTAIRKQ